MKDVIQELEWLKGRCGEDGYYNRAEIVQYAINEIERLRAAAAGANAGAEIERHVRLLEHFEAGPDTYTLRAHQAMHRKSRRLLQDILEEGAARAAVRADEHSDEKSADTPVT